MKTQSKHSITLLSTLCILSLFLTGCTMSSSTNFKIDQENVVSSSVVSYDDWTEETHTKNVEPNSDMVFPQDAVNRLDIVIEKEQWEVMMDNMTSLYGEPGTGEEKRGEMQRTRPEGAGGERVRPEGGGPQDLQQDSENPVFVESQVFFNGQQWYNVGTRFKGNSSLKSVWSSGILKLPLKLDFDEFEDEYPELKNQRFYGFKQLSFSSGFEDDSLLHEKLASEVFDSAGVVAPQTAFYEMYVDYGEGPVYFGLYTAVEVIADSLLETSFGNTDGNLYKAEGTATNLSSETINELQEGFVKKSNEEEDDWADLENLYIALHSEKRLLNAEEWRQDIEKVFDVDAFLNWLAVNTVVQNWDTYGSMTHNYYLYNNEETDQLTWIPWDNNESFSEGKRGGVTLSFTGVSDDWPLIRYFMDDSVYREKYVTFVKSFINETLNTDEFKNRIETLHAMITPFVIGEGGETEKFTFIENDDVFINSLEKLQEHVSGRIEAGLRLSLEENWGYDETLASANQKGPGGQVEGLPPEGGELPPTKNNNGDFQE